MYVDNQQLNSESSLLKCNEELIYYLTRDIIVFFYSILHIHLYTYNVGDYIILNQFSS